MLRCYCGAQVMPVAIALPTSVVSEFAMPANTEKRSRHSSSAAVRAKLDRSRHSARECRARKKLRYQYMEELIASREQAVYALRDELNTVCVQSHFVLTTKCIWAEHSVFKTDFHQSYISSALWDKDKDECFRFWGQRSTSQWNRCAGNITLGRDIKRTTLKSEIIK